MNQLSWYADKNTGLYKLFEYDDAGNITSVQDYRLLYTNGWIPGGLIEEHTYSYGDNNWKDKLTKYENQTITYDANGNPLQYRDGMSFTWVNGRTLDTVTVSGNTIQMQYDYNGMCTQKGSTKYYYDSSNNLIGMVKGTHTLLFYYDENSNPTAFTDNGAMYFYIKNLQGDIVKIVNRSGSVIVNYTYDALGKILSVKDAADNEITDLNSLALLNPLRYRGYVYDDETGLYYLQSRYYDPTIGRFVNADTLFDTVSGTPLSTNMFAYCENNPILRIDDNGNWYYNLNDYYEYLVGCRNRYINRSQSSKQYYQFKKIYLSKKSFYDNVKKIYDSNCNRYRPVGFIYGQSSNTNVSNLLWGARDRHVADYGCGGVVLYNAMCRIAPGTNFVKVLLELHLNNLFSPAGGMYFSGVLSYLNAHNIKYKVFNSKDEFDDNMHLFSMAIVRIHHKNASSGHFYLVIRVGNKYFSLNKKDSDSNLKTLLNFSRIIDFTNAACIY